MLITTNAKTKCDVRDCKNDAEFYFETKGRNGKFFICKQCFDKLVAEALNKSVPKSPKNTIKRIIDRKEEERNYAEK